MKLLTTNFLTCAVKSCKSSPSSFPLHFKDATLERTEIDYNPLFLRNILPRVNWDALTTTATELGLQSLVPASNPVDTIITNTSTPSASASALAPADEQDEQQKDEEQNEEQLEQVLKKLHNLLLETGVVEGKLVCANCGFEYPIKEGVGNFLLPAHLV